MAVMIELQSSRRKLNTKTAIT